MDGPGRMNRDEPEWARRRSANIRLAVLFGVMALLVFVLALWKFRPF